MLFEQNDGELHIFQPPQIASKTKTPADSPPLTRKQLSEQLLEELPEGFRIHTTKNYVVAYQTERSYAKWIGNLYEGKLKKKFRLFWKNHKFRIHAEEPVYPLVAIIFANKESYAAWALRELGQPADDVVAYYNLMTNRVIMYDLTADRHDGQGGGRDMNQIFQDPRSIPMVTTIIHEGTHQLMFNTGLQTRLADTPYWLNEGIAMYFETPDLNNQQGWNGPGKVNRERLAGMLVYSRSRPENSLETLIATDDRLRVGGIVSGHAYAESWSLIHFLIKRKPSEFTDYLKHLAQKKRLVADSPEQRIADFKQFFGDDFKSLDNEFLQYLQQLK